MQTFQLLYNYKKYKKVYKLVILTSVFLFITNIILYNIYHQDINALLMLIFAVASIILLEIYNACRIAKYRVFLSIKNHKYITPYLYLVISIDSYEKKAYDKIFDEITEQKWKTLVQKFYELEKEEYEYKQIKIKEQELKEKMKYEKAFEENKWFL